MTDENPTQPRPRLIDWALYAILVQAVFSVLAALAQLGEKSYLTKQILDAQTKAFVKDQKKKLPYDLTAIDTPKGRTPNGKHDVSYFVHSSQVSGLIYGLLFGVIVVLLGLQVRRGRGWARWVFLVVAVLTTVPFRVLQIGSDEPALLKITSVLSGVASIAAIVLLLLPESSRWFASLRPAGGSPRGLFSNGRPRPAAGGSTPAQPIGLRGLFAPRPRPQPRTRPTGGKADLTKPQSKPASVRPAGAASDPVPAANDATSRGKAKARTAPAADVAPARPRGKAKGR